MYVYICILRGFKSSGDAFLLPHFPAFDCSIRPFWDLFHSWLYLSHLSRFFGDDLVFSVLQDSSRFLAIETFHISVLPPLGLCRLWWQLTNTRLLKLRLCLRRSGRIGAHPVFHPTVLEGAKLLVTSIQCSVKNVSSHTTPWCSTCAKAPVYMHAHSSQLTAHWWFCNLLAVLEVRIRCVMNVLTDIFSKFSVPLAPIHSTFNFIKLYISQRNAQFSKLIFNCYFCCLLHVSNLLGSSSGRQLCV
jgi:hypothetical protein